MWGKTIMDLILTIEGARQSGKSYILAKIQSFLEILGYETEIKHGANIKTEHQIIIKNNGDIIET